MVKYDDSKPKLVKMYNWYKEIFNRKKKYYEGLNEWVRVTEINTDLTDEEYEALLTLET